MTESLSDRLAALAASDMLPMHMPGHKRNLEKFPWLGALRADMDITEIEGFDDLNAPEGLFRELNALTARTWGAEQSIVLTGGSTAGILAACWLTLRAGGKLLMARGSHKSLYHGAMLTGADTAYLTPPVLPGTGIWGSVMPQSVRSALEGEPDICLVAVTSPTYEGVISDIAGIAEVCHSRGVPLLVDEAHGAHLGFGGFPLSAVRLGADLVVESLHKTLPSPTGTAVLHLNGSLVDRALAQSAVSLFQSSSPSYLLSAGLDGCVRYMAEKGDAAAEEWLRLAGKTRERLKTLRRLCLLDETPEIYALDPSKLVLLTDRASVTGPELARFLREREHIETEMASRSYVIAMTGLGDTAGSLARFADAVCRLDGTVGLAEHLPALSTPPLPERVCSLREAAGKEGKSVPLESAVGAVSAEFVWAYPPGAPLLAPGERLTGELLARLLEMKRAGLNVRSSAGGFPQSLFILK